MAGVASVPLIDADVYKSLKNGRQSTILSGGIEFEAPIRMSGIDVGMISGKWTVLSFFFTLFF